VRNRKGRDIMITKARISKNILAPSQDAENYFNLKRSKIF
jgi:hypothetical protein